MLRSAKQLHGSRIHATDDQIGRVDDVYFDDEAWTVRYLVVDTGTWLPGRKVLISPYSINTPITAGKSIDVSLTRDQVRNSPDIDTHQPVSRRHERDYLKYYGYPSYWDLGGAWGASEFPIFPNAGELRDAVPQDPPAGPDSSDEDSHLRSTSEVKGYDIGASDGSIGHLQDFIFDDESWTIRYLVIDTVKWWPGGKKVLVATRWIDHIDWELRQVFTALSRETVKNSPPYDETRLLDRQYEEQLHEAHQRAGYWE